MMESELHDVQGSESESLSASFSPEITHYLLVVIGESLSQEYVEPSLTDVEKALQCWDIDGSAIGYDAVLQTTAASDVIKTGLVHRSLAHCGTNMGVVILINPVSSDVTNELRQLLLHPATHKHLVFGGHWMEGSGDWALHDDTFTLHDIAGIFSEAEVDEAILKSSQDQRQTLVVSGCHWQAATMTKQAFSKSLNLTINPQDSKNSAAGISLLIQTIRTNLILPTPFELLEPPTMGVGVKCKITKPTVLIFPSGKGDCAFFAVTDFSLFLGGGYCTKSCFWKFAKHLHRIDAIMAPHMQPDSLIGFNSILRRKIAEQQLTEPEKGTDEYEDWLVKCNSPEVGVVYLNAPENKKSSESLGLKTISQGNLTQQLLQELYIKPFSCTANTGKILEPITLYQKVGIGRLDMFILAPVQDSKELKDFMQQWSGNKTFTKVKTGMKVNGKETEAPVSSAVSICALIVWQPANQNEEIVKVLFPGNAPQNKILEGLDRLKHLDYLKYPEVTAARLSKGGAQLKKKTRVSSSKPATKANGLVSGSLGTKGVAVTSNSSTVGVGINNQCNDGIHCGTPPPESSDNKCSDGIHCGTPPPDDSDNKCSDGIHCGTPPPEDSDNKCSDGIHCGTPPPEDSYNKCSDGIHCGTPPPEDSYDKCSDGIHCGTPPPEDSYDKCSDGIHCGTPPPEDSYNEGACDNNFIPIEPYKCPDGANCNTPPPETGGLCTGENNCNTPPPDEYGAMDTQQSPVDNEPQATVQGDLCANVMDSNLPESQQGMAAFAFNGSFKQSDNTVFSPVQQKGSSDRLASGEITPSDQVEYGEESSNGNGSPVFDTDANSKAPGLGEYAEEDHTTVVKPTDGLVVEYDDKAPSDEDEMPTDDNQSPTDGIGNYTSSPNGGPHPWEPRIEFSSPEQEPEENYLIGQQRPEADNESVQVSVQFSEQPPSVVLYEAEEVEQNLEAESPEQEDDIIEDEEDSSESSQASEIEVKLTQKSADEAIHVDIPSAQVEEDIVEYQGDKEEVQLFTTDQSEDQEEPPQKDPRENTEQFDTKEQNLEDGTGSPVIHTYEEYERDAIQADQVEDVESPVPEEDQAIADGQYQEQEAESLEAWNQQGEEINQNFMVSREIPTEVEETEIDQHPGEMNPHPEADMQEEFVASEEPLQFGEEPVSLDAQTEDNIDHIVEHTDQLLRVEDSEEYATEDARLDTQPDDNFYQETAEQSEMVPVEADDQNDVHCFTEDNFEGIEETVDQPEESQVENVQYVTDNQLETEDSREDKEILTRTEEVGDILEDVSAGMYETEEIPSRTEEAQEEYQLEDSAEESLEEQPEVEHITHHINDMPVQSEVQEIEPDEVPNVHSNVVDVEEEQEFRSEEVQREIQHEELQKVEFPDKPEVEPEELQEVGFEEEPEVKPEEVQEVEFEEPEVKPEEVQEVEFEEEQDVKPQEVHDVKFEDPWEVNPKEVQEEEFEEPEVNPTEVQEEEFGEPEVKPIEVQEEEFGEPEVKPQEVQEVEFEEEPEVKPQEVHDVKFEDPWKVTPEEVQEVEIEEELEVGLKEEPDVQEVKLKEIQEVQSKEEEDSREGQQLQEHPEFLEVEPSEIHHPAEEAYSPVEVHDNFTFEPQKAEEEVIQAGLTHPEILIDSVPEFDVKAPIEQDTIQEEEFVPTQSSSSDRLGDSAPETRSDQGSDSDVQLDREPDLASEKEHTNETYFSEPSRKSPGEIVQEAASEQQQPSSEIKLPNFSPVTSSVPEPNQSQTPTFDDTVKVDTAPDQTSESKTKVKPNSIVSKTKTTMSTKTSIKSATTTKKPSDKTKKDVKTSKSIVKDSKSTTRTKPSTVTEKKPTPKATSTTATKNADVEKKPAGVSKKPTTSTERKPILEKKIPEKKASDKRPLEKKTLKATTATGAVSAEKKSSRLSAARPSTGTTPTRDKSPSSKLWEKQTAASASRSSSNTSRTRTNGSGDIKPGPPTRCTPLKKSTPNKLTKTTPKTTTPVQKPTGSKTTGSNGRRLADPAKKESEKPTRSAPSRSAGDAKRSETSKRPGSTTSKTTAALPKTPAIPVSGPPVYVDLTYIPNHASEDSVNMEFFRRIRSKNYVISANNKGRNQPSTTVMDALLEGRSKWDDPEAEVTVIPTYDITVLQDWERKHLTELTDSKVTISQPASRSIVQMKDENFFMYKVEF